MDLHGKQSFLELQPADIPDLARRQSILPIAPEYLPGVIEMLQGLHRHIRVVADAMRDSPVDPPAGTFEP